MAGTGGRRDLPPLRKIHSDEFIEAQKRPSLAAFRKMSTADLVASLAPGQPEPLTVKRDGRVLQGNTRIKVLEERGYDVDSLPRVVLD